MGAGWQRWWRETGQEREAREVAEHERVMRSTYPKLIATVRSPEPKELFWLGERDHYEYVPGLTWDPNIPVAMPKYHCTLRGIRWTWRDELRFRVGMLFRPFVRTPVNIIEQAGLARAWRRIVAWCSRRRPSRST